MTSRSVISRESESTTVIGPPEARTCKLVATRPSFPATNPLPRPVAVLMSTTDALARAEICAGVRDPPAAGSAPALRDAAASTAATRYKDWRLRVVIRSTHAYPSCPVRVEDRRCVTLGRRAAVPWDTSADALRVRGNRWRSSVRGVASRLLESAACTHVGLWSR